jgi:protein-disulfide isomerase
MTPVHSDEQDLTRKQRREQAREQRRALEQAEVASAARRTRLMQLGVVVAVVVVAIVIVLIASGGGSHAKPKPGSPAAVKAASEVSGLVSGIPQSGNVLGSPSAPGTLQYFGDLQCPVCKDFTLQVLPTLIEKWVRPGKMKIEYRSLETATHEQEVFKTQQIAALAAGKQNKMWDYIELFYHDQGEENSGYVSERFLQELAQVVPGLSLSQWSTDRNDSSLASQVATDAQAANNAGFNGTPSFLIGKTGGALSKLSEVSVTSPAPYNEVIEKLLKS